MSTQPIQKSERRSRQRAANKAAILDAARALALREGAGELSLRGVAAEAGYAPASVYEYFQNRADLVLTLAGDDLARVARALKSPAQEATSRAGMGAALRMTLEMLRANGPLGAAMMSLQSGEAPAETERFFNGKLIAAMTAFAEACDRLPVTDREVQGDIVLVVSSLIGLTVLSRAGRLKLLGFSETELLERLERRFARSAS